MPNTSKLTDKLHARLNTNKHLECSELSDSACNVQRGNYLLLLMASMFSKIADALTSAKVVLPWMMATTGAPVFLTSLLVPIRESGAMLPQIILGAYIRGFTTRKHFLIYGALLQSLVVFALLYVALNFTGSSAGIAIVSLTVLFSLFRAISSIANKDVLGKTIDKSKRGTLSGTAASMAGAVSIALGAFLYFRDSKFGGVDILLSLGACCFLLSALSFGFIKEFAESKKEQTDTKAIVKRNLQLITDDPQFLRFVIVRSLMISSGLAAPYFVLQAQANQTSNLVSLASLVVLGGVASFISGRIWGKLADKNSKRLMTFTALINSMICGLAAIFIWLNESNSVYYLMLFFTLLIVHEGVRQGRKTYLVDMAKGNQRTDYVSVSNSFIGVVLLVIGLISGVIAQYSLVAVMACFTLFSFLAFLLSFTLNNVSKIGD
ncbi:MFS transporter [Pseudoalteromonas piratica]|uniref:MFS transporter n=1 Tax=Pseudoalteromonas piratica TaxID=1348114 RepID=A0A0A7EKH0_9GAMM|nr:MFS transporter [Pseudoalteromonas piratica]AIY66477.1 hypothetical protein OM33_15070 [Pseudoalteromonas piratica]